jgi:hypothetical protein
VTVSDGAASCQVTLASGTGSCQLTSTTAGTKTLTATYAGDLNFSGSVLTGVSHTVNLISTSTTITAVSAASSTVGQSYTVDFDVSPTGGTRNTPVTVTDGTDSCSATPNVGSCTLVSTTAGAKTLVATYPGDATHSSSSSAGTPHTVNTASTITTITSHAPDPSVLGQQVTVNYTVTSGFGTPAGNVDVSDGTDGCTGSVAAGSCSFAPTTSGSKTITVTYAGDATHSGSSDNVAHQVDPFGAADHLVFSVQPSDATLGGIISPAVTVRIEDTFGNLVSNATDVVSMVIANDPVGTSVLTYTSPVSAVGGVATFTDLSINNPGSTPGTGFTLQASSGSLTAATSAAFNVN